MNKVYFDKNNIIRKIRSYPIFANEQLDELFILAGSILFLSFAIFSYDEEKVIALSLMSFFFIFYFNFGSSLNNALAEKGNLLEEELVKLFTEKKVMMRKLRRYWRIFLDLEDITIEVFYWTRRSLKKILSVKLKNREFYFFHFLKSKYQSLIDHQYKINKNFELINLNQIKSSLNMTDNYGSINYDNLLKNSFSNVFTKNQLKILNKNSSKSVEYNYNFSK